MFDVVLVLRAAGPVYKLAFGPRSFIVVSDPVMAKHVLRSGVTDYDKGVLASVRAKETNLAYLHNKFVCCGVAAQVLIACRTVLCSFVTSRACCKHAPETVLSCC